MLLSGQVFEGHIVGRTPMGALVRLEGGDVGCVPVVQEIARHAGEEMTMVRVLGFAAGSLLLSETHPDIVRELIRQEVPEVAAGLVAIVAIAREAGSRTKVAVHALLPGIDAKGACIGPGGSRARAMSARLHGERIEIHAHSTDPALFVADALSPARALRVEIQAETRIARVTVPRSQMSLAIGSGGQNARLAARLTGYRIDIVPHGETPCEPNPTTEDGQPEALTPAQVEKTTEEE